MRFWGLLAAVSMTSGAARAAPRIAVHPLVVTGGDPRSNNEARSVFLIEAARLEIETIARGDVTDALAGVPGKSCLGVDGCLLKLSHDTGATYALLVTMKLDGPNFVIGASVIGSDGVEVRKVGEQLAPKKALEAFRPQLLVAFKKLFDVLTLPTLPEQRPPVVAVVPDTPLKPAPVEPLPTPVEPTVVPEVKVTPEPRPPPEVVAMPDEPESPGTPPMRIVGLVVGGLALAGAGVGTFEALSANSDAAQLRPLLRGTNLPQGDATASALAKGIDQKSSLATGVFIGSSVAALASIALVLLSVDWSEHVALVPESGGATVGLRGTF